MTLLRHNSCFTSLFLVLVSSIVILLGCSSEPSKSPNEKNRAIVNNAIESRVDPKINIRIDPSLKFVGRFDFTIKADSTYDKEFWFKDIAAGERIIFADVRTNIAGALFIAQFEGFLPDNDMIYRYHFDNAIKLGGMKFKNNSLIYDDVAYARERPGNEAQLTRDFLTAKGIAMPKDLFMTRFVTVTDSTRKKEMILFYIEDAQNWDLDADQFDKGLMPKKTMDSLMNQFKNKALKLFKVE